MSRLAVLAGFVGCCPVCQMFLRRMFSAVPGLTAALLFAATAGPAAAAPSQPPPTESAETRFVLFALEDLFRDTWADVDSVGDARTVRGLVADRRHVLDDLTQRARDAKLGGERNAELIEMLEVYKKFLSERGERLAAALDKHQETLNAKWLAIWGAKNREAAAKRLNAARRTTLTAMDYMSRPNADPLVGLFGGLFLGMLEEAAISREVWLKARGEFCQFYMREKPNYDRRAKELAAVLVRGVRADVDERRKKAEALSRALAEKRKWKPDETPFAAGSGSGQRQTDFFTQMRRIKDSPVTTDKGDSREAADRAAKARRYLKAVELVPTANHGAYKYYRARAYAKAGREANLAANLTVGTNGFSARTKNEAARLSLSAWNLFVANHNRDFTGEDLHHYMVALAYNGKAFEAYVRFKANTKLASAPAPVIHCDITTLCPEARPREVKKGEDKVVPWAFDYDKARICALAAEQLASAPPQYRNVMQRQFQAQLGQPLTPAIMLQDSSLALERAVRAGFKDTAQAREMPDLKQLRAADAKVLGWRRTFDQIVAGR